MWTLTTHLVPSQVKIYGAGRSRILQALGRRPETLSSHGPEEEKTQLPAFHISQEPRGLRACPTSNPRRPAQHSRHEAKGSADQDSSLSQDLGTPEGGGSRTLRQNTFLSGTNLYCYECIFQSI